MKIIFLGTKGYIDVWSRWHKRHTITLIVYKGKRVAIDCGLDWQRKLNKIKADAFVITHAHPDHVDGLKKGSPVPVYATRDSWKIMKRFAIKKQYRHKIIARKPFKIGAITFEAFHVIHSIKAPAVGYRITAGNVTIFCVHDLISIPQRHKALSGCKLYIGDGATILRPLVRRKDSKIFGHTTIRAQLGWCKKEKVPRAIITHCGSQIVAANKKKIDEQIKKLGKERGVDAEVAYDGMKIILT
jgi:phosphoribosyl 1,2-cyclic phosphodiesterase